jgi:hypothetical protein
VTGENGAVPKAVVWLMIATTGILTLGAVQAYLRFIRVADELLRRIQLEALSLGFGAGAVFTLNYRLLERIGAQRLTVSAPFVIMMLFWAGGQNLGVRRYLPTDDL